MPPEPDGLPLLTYAGMVWRRKFLVVLIALGMAAPAYAISTLQPPVYQASGQVLLVQQVVDDSFNVRTADLNDRQVGIQVALLSGDAVAELARQEGAVSRVRVQSSANSNVVTLTAADGNPEQAAATVAAYIRAFGTSRVRQSEQAIDSAAAQLDRHIDRLQEQISRLPESLERRALEEQRTSVQGQLSQLAVQRGLVQNGLTVVQNPVPPAAPASPNPIRDGALGLVIGVVLGISLAVLLETVRRRRSLSSDSELAPTPAIDARSRETAAEKAVAPPVVAATVAVPSAPWSPPAPRSTPRSERPSQPPAASRPVQHPQFTHGRRHRPS